MACNNEYRHVCLKDLENYIERDKYFSDFSKAEIELIQKNLGITTSDGYNPTLVLGDYKAIYNQTKSGSLRIGYLYAIQDFQSIYLDVNGKVCGTEDHIPSQTYWLLLTPNSTTSFDSRVRLQQPAGTGECEKWVAEYDITPQTFADGTTSKGTITFLKDSNNNYAYYDFKNIRFLKTLKELNKGAETFTEDAYLYTFDNGGADASEKSCKNNHLEKGAIRNVFMGDTRNVTLAADCHDNLFFKGCENSTFGYGTYGNFFKDYVKRCDGTVHEKELDSMTSSNYPKHFDVLDDKEVMAYLDSETQTYQFRVL